MARRGGGAGRADVGRGALCSACRPRGPCPKGHHSRHRIATANAEDAVGTDAAKPQWKLTAASKCQRTLLQHENSGPMNRSPASVMLVVLAAFAASACTSLSGLGGESKFKCPMPDGVPCMSMSEVDSSYRAGVLPGQHRPPPVSLGEPTSQGSPARAGGDDAPVSTAAAEGGNTGAASPAQPAPAAPTAARWLPQRERPMPPRQAVADREALPTAAAIPIGAIRTEPTIIRIWIAPWEDADGDLNDQGYVYLQIDAGRWLIEHNREQIQRAFAPAQAVTAPSRPAATGSTGAQR